MKGILKKWTGFEIFFVVVQLYLVVLPLSCNMLTGPYDIITENLTTATDPTFADIVTIVHTDAMPNKIDILVDIVHDVDYKFYIQGTVGIILSKNTIQKFIVGKHIEGCSFFAKPKQDKFLEMLFRMLRDFGNKMHSCPLKKMNFNITGMELRSDYFPSFMPSGRFKAALQITKLSPDGRLHLVMFSSTWIGKFRRK